MVRRGSGAFAALALAGLAYLFKNRESIGNKLSQLGNRAQGQLSGPTSSESSEPRPYTGETQRI
ncbi:MAG TPA: hypothetical protein VGE07_26260 [Herpetosiphonaceae bacterium]